MQIFVTGTDTDIGKTLVCSWLCLHTGYGYFKPIQTGASFGSDADKVIQIANVKIYQEVYKYDAPVSPELAATNQNQEIIIDSIKLPTRKGLIVEGAGGVMVPINTDCFMIDLIRQLNLPVVIVASTKLGTINHTLLTLMALRAQDIKTLGVILTGKANKDNYLAIKNKGKVEILAHIPLLDIVDQESLIKIPLGENLKQILR
jgi:dethiobiotin synthetase